MRPEIAHERPKVPKAHIRFLVHADEQRRRRRKVAAADFGNDWRLDAQPAGQAPVVRHVEKLMERVEQLLWVVVWVVGHRIFHSWYQHVV